LVEKASEFGEKINQFFNVKQGKLHYIYSCLK
jgi:hypothetical protein